MATESFRYLSEPHWYLWEGGFLLIGRGQGVVPPHMHHAIQIVVALEGVIAIRGAHDPWHQSRGIVVQQNVEHSFDALGSLGAMLFVDPESTEGRWLSSTLDAEITLVSEARAAAPAAALRAFAERSADAMEIGALIRHCVQSLCAGVPPTRRMDPRVTTVLNSIRASEELRMSLESAAALAFLSPTRFQHLFKDQMGLPFRRYVLWRKLTRAMVAIGSSQSIADAAHAADFADAAHLTRTFYQMVGIAPSALMRGKFAEIPSPFSAPS